MNSDSIPAPRLADVARLAGVSLATASRVLNGSTRKVADSYRQRVFEAAKELGYTANLSAQATARGTSNLLALIVADIAGPYFSNIASGVARKAGEAGLVVTIATTDRDEQREAGLLQALRGQRPRSVILAASRTREPIAEHALDLIASGSTVVALGHPRTDGPVRWLGVDNRKGAELLGEQMGALGYRRAIIIAGEEGICTSDDRVEGFTRGFTSTGGNIAMIRRSDFNREGAKGAMENLIEEGHVKSNSAPTLIFAISDVMAIGTLRAARAHGLKIGSEVAVCGFDDITTAVDMTPELTTVRLPLVEMGYYAAALAVDRDEVIPDLPVSVIVRDSTPPVTSPYLTAEER